MIANVDQLALPKRWFELKNHPTIAEAYACQARFQFYRSGRRSYKSELCKRKGIMKLPLPGKFGPRRIAYTSYTEKKAEDVFWSDMFTLIPKSWWKGYSKSKKEIYTVFGSMIKVGGPNDIEGQIWDDIYVTESADVPPSVISIIIMPALADTGGSLTREGVPKRKGKGARDYNRAFDYARKNRTFLGTDVEARAFSWHSSAILSPRELAIQKALLDPKDFREQFEATIESASGCVFHSWGADNIDQVDSEGKPKRCLYYPHLPIILTIDLNVSPMCWVLAHDVEGQLWVFDELQEYDTHTQACLDKVVSVYGDHDAGWLVYGDSSSKNRSVHTPITSYALVANEDRLRNKRVWEPRANPGVANRNASVNRLMRDAAGNVRLLVSPKCKGLIEDIEYLAYDERGNVDDQNGKVGHFSDALGYAIHSRYPIMLDGGSGMSGIAVMQG